MTLLLAALPLLVTPCVDRQQPRPAGLQHPYVHFVHPVVPPLLQPYQVNVLRAVCERLAPPAVVVAVVKEEMVGHAIVTKKKEVVKARSATMAQEDKTRDVIVAKEFDKPMFVAVV